MANRYESRGDHMAEDASVWAGFNRGKYMQDRLLVWSLFVQFGSEKVLEGWISGWER